MDYAGAFLVAGSMFACVYGILSPALQKIASAIRDAGLSRLEVIVLYSAPFKLSEIKDIVEHRTESRFPLAEVLHHHGDGDEGSKVSRRVIQIRQEIRYNGGRHVDTTYVATIIYLK